MCVPGSAERAEARMEGGSWSVAEGASVCIKVASETLCFPSFMSTALVLAKVSPAEAES